MSVDILSFITSNLWLPTWGTWIEVTATEATIILIVYPLVRFRGVIKALAGVDPVMLARMIKRQMDAEREAEDYDRDKCR